MATTVNLEGKAWSTFLDVELAPQTKDLYGRWIQNFMGYCIADNPDKLLEIGTVQQIEDKVIAWLGSLKDSGKASATFHELLV
jgi:hypothetical protein